MNVKSLLVGSVVLMAPVLSANAQSKHEWFLLNYQNGECESAAHKSFGWDSPAGAYKAIRAIGKIDSIKEVRDGSGKLFVAMVVIENEGTHFDYFPSLADCKEGKARLVAGGALPPDMAELQ